MHDPVDLTARLVRCPSVTPDEGGALVLLEGMLASGGFECTRIDRGGVSNLIATWGGDRNGKRFGFNGHTDVVPVGDLAAWSVDPFGAEVIDGYLYGRGATDMKSGVASFVTAALDFVADTPPDGALILTITGDEEGLSTDGTLAILDWMKANGVTMDACLVGEPTCPNTLGDMIKIGRRGALTAHFTATGTQGHSAYPRRANNPIHAMVTLMAALTEAPLDDGSAHFDPSTLQIVTMDTGNPANNVIPATTRATVNIRYNDNHTGDSVKAWLAGHARAVEAETGVAISLETKNSGESFVTPPGPLSQMVSRAVEAETGQTPELSTSGGTSDARFVKDHCPVIEFGLVGERMHAVDERVRVADIHRLKTIYARILTDYFAKH
ncbi:MAG: succinyl-diaminopimelate desuccinylase [Pseudomonadota bacterium]